MTPPDDPVKRSSLAALALGALGVVYGDIGTSPLYTVQTVFNPKEAADAPWGVVTVAVGTFFLLRNLDVIDWRFHDIWPLFLVLAGVALIARSLADRRGHLPAGSGSPENGGAR